MSTRSRIGILLPDDSIDVTDDEQLMKNAGSFNVHQTQSSTSILSSTSHRKHRKRDVRNSTEFRKESSKLMVLVYLAEMLIIRGARN